MRSSSNIKFLRDGNTTQEGRLCPHLPLTADLQNRQHTELRILMQLSRLSDSGLLPFELRICCPLSLWLQGLILNSNSSFLTKKILLLYNTSTPLAIISVPTFPALFQNTNLKLSESVFSELQFQRAPSKDLYTCTVSILQKQP